MKAFVIDVELCVGCYACQFVCKDEHVGNDWSPIAKPQPDTGQFWMRLDEHIRGTVPKVEMHYVPNPCMHCDEPPCVPALPHRGRHLQARRRAGDHRLGQVHRLPPVRGCLPLRGHLLQRRPQPGAEVHRLRPPARRRRMEDPPLRRRLPHRGHQVRRGERVRGRDRQGRGAQARAWPQAARLLPEHPQEVRRRARSTTRSTRKWSSAPPAPSPARMARSRRRPPTASATSGSAAWPTTPPTS